MFPSKLVEKGIKHIKPRHIVMIGRGFFYSFSLIGSYHLVEGHTGVSYAEAFFLEFLLAMLHGRNGYEVYG